MAAAVAWLALEVETLDRSLAFYRDTLSLPVLEEHDAEAVFGVNGTALRLRTPGPVPRGGLHVHYAFSTPPASYDAWWDRLAADRDLHEERFGDARSLYCFDPDGHCVEIGERDGCGDGLTGIFEVVLEVEALDAAEAFWGRLADDVVDRGTARRRVRLDLDAVDLELWEPQLGIADARGGVHVDLGLVVDDVGGLAASLEPVAASISAKGDGRRLRDPDGHYVTLVPGR